MREISRSMPAPPAPGARTIAVALHGIEPATFERCAVIRDWLDDHGVDRVTLLVIPARDLHPVGERSPEMVELAGERRDAGDSIAQHGFQHVRLRRAPGRRCSPTGPASSQASTSEETRRAVHAGWRVMKLAGIEPDGFVAPAYAYTAALREALRRRFRWWADAAAGAPRAPAPDGGTRRRPRARPAFSLAADGLARPRCSRRRWSAPARCCRRARCALDLHPADLRHAAPHDGARVGAAALAQPRGGHLPPARRRAEPRSVARPGPARSAATALKRLDGGQRRRSRGGEAEHVLDRAQQREVVVRFLAARAALDERREQQRARRPPPPWSQLGRWCRFG